jgi:hypothetical protein
MYLLYLCIKKSQRSTIGDGSPLTVMYSLLRKYYPCTFCTCAKKKSAVNHRRWFSADCLSIPFSESTAHVPFVLVHKKKSAVNHRRWFSADCYVFPSQKVLPMYLLYLCIKKSQRSTIGDGSPLTVYLFPSQKVLPMYLLYLCKIQVSGRQPSAMVLR